MGYPMLIAAIKSAGFRQWNCAELAEISEPRLSVIINRGGATAGERQKLSQLFGLSETVLFGPGLPVKVFVAAAATGCESEAIAETK